VVVAEERRRACLAHRIRDGSEQRRAEPAPACVGQHEHLPDRERRRGQHQHRGGDDRVPVERDEAPAEAVRPVAVVREREARLTKRPLVGAGLLDRVDRQQHLVGRGARVDLLDAHRLVAAAARA
jgi:hypothetical protein